LAVLAIFGPTASGKTAVAEALAEARAGSSRQTPYRLPRRPDPDRPAIIPTPRRDWGLDHDFVAEYQRLAHATIDADRRRRTPTSSEERALLPGGAVRAVAAASAATGHAGALEHLYHTLGPEGAHALLAAKDAGAAARVHPNDRRRIVRALELAELGSSLAPAADELWSHQLRHPTGIVGLDVGKEELERRIRARAHAMFEAGVAGEVAASRNRSHRPPGHRPPGDRRVVGTKPRRHRRAHRQYANNGGCGGSQVCYRRRRPPGEIADEILEMERSRERLPTHGGAGSALGRSGTRRG
jgi:hypothetical protein